MARRTDIQSVNALAELERLSWKYEPVGASEVKLRCPAHDDDTPSASLNTSSNLWTCHACQARGDVVSLLAHIAGVKRETILVDLSKRYDLTDAKQINPEIVERMHSKIWEAGPLLTALRDRGVTDDMIRRARLGYHDGRITIPVYDLAGRIVNVRRYLPGAPSERKMLNTSGHGKLALYQPDQLTKCEKVWFCGGEMKALVVGALLEHVGVGACSATGGEGSWSNDWGPLFQGKRVWVCMDVDDPGKHAAKKIADSLYRLAQEVRVVQLPLDRAKYPKGDVNDYVGHESATAEDLIRLMDLSQPVQPVAVRIGQTELGTRRTTLDKIAMRDSMGWRLEVEAVVSAMDVTPYLVPNEVDVACTRDQPNCHVCPIRQADQNEHGFTRQEIKATSCAVLECTNAPTSLQNATIRTGLGIPVCRTVEFTIRNHHVVSDVRLSPKLTIGGHSDDRMQPALLVNLNAELNVPYLTGGRVYPHPKTQQSTLVMDAAVQTEDSLDTFAPSPAQLAELEVFRPRDDSDVALAEKLDEIYDDLETNVTRIYGRRALHAIVDLCYHSSLFFEMGGRKHRGWVNVLVAGDSSQGKTEATTCLMNHYRLGERVECKNATVAGLLGGLQQIGGRWFVSWGVIPKHDRRLVILEEIKGMSQEVLAKLTDMRSSGIAEIPKIERRRTHARTRLVFVSNPRSARSLSTYSFGVEAIHELIGSLEDVRRFDAALLLAAGVVDPSKLNHKTIAHRFTSDLCHRLVLWAWTRSDPCPLVPADAEAAITEAADALCGRYSERMPLIDRGSAHLKIAKLSVALACRVYSTDGTGRVVVRLQHVRAVRDFLIRCYEDKAMGYADYSRATTELSRLTDTTAVERYLMGGVKNSKDLVHGLLYRDDFISSDVQDWCGLDRDDAGLVLSFLVRHHAVRRGRNATYAKTPEFISMLQRLESKAQNAPAAEEEM